MNAAATAYHEAGHGIAAWRLRIPIKSLSIKQKHDSHGRMALLNPRLIDFNTASRDRAQLWAEARIMMALAGPLAQRRYSPRTVRGWHGQGDFTFAADLALRLNGSGELATAHLKWMEVSAEALVAANWRFIEKVALALLDEGEMDADRMLALILPRPTR